MEFIIQVAEMCAIIVSGIVVGVGICTLTGLFEDVKKDQ